jgi:hypothetical protein
MKRRKIGYSQLLLRALAGVTAVGIALAGVPYVCTHPGRWVRLATIGILSQYGPFT